MGSSTTRSFTFTNTGNAPATGVQASVSGAGLSLTANTCGTSANPVTVAAGASCSMTVQWAPAADGALSGASLSVASSAGNSPSSLGLDGTGELVPGEQWTAVSTGTTNTVTTMSYNGASFVAVTSAGLGYGVVVSSDGVNWTSTALASSSYGTPAQNFAIPVSPTQHAFGGMSTSPVLSQVFRTSNTGSFAGAGTAGFSGNPGIYAAAVGPAGDVVIVGAAGQIRQAPNISSLGSGTVRTSGTTQVLRGVTPGEVNGVLRWVVVGNSGTVLTSPDGVTWTGRASGVSVPLYDVAYGNGQFIAVGGSGRVLSSTDGVSWTNVTLPGATTLHAVAFGNGVFVAAGDSGYLATSVDGVNWVQKNPMLGTSSIQDVRFYANRFFAVGAGGKLSYSN